MKSPHKYLAFYTNFCYNIKNAMRIKIKLSSFHNTIMV